MTITEMRELPPVELKSEIDKARASLWKLRFQARGEPIENPGALRQLKRDIARMLTVLNGMAPDAAAGSGSSTAGSAGATDAGEGNGEAS